MSEEGILSRTGQRVVDGTANVISNHTCKLFWTLLVFMFLLSLGAVLNGNLTPSEDNEYSWLPPSSTSAKRRDAIDQAGKLVDRIGGGEIEPRTRTNNDWVLIILYDFGEDSNIFTPENLKAMCETEATMLNISTYSNFCQLQDSDTCAGQGSSIVSVFYGDQLNTRCPLLDEVTVQNRVQFMYDQLNTTEGKLTYGKYFGNDYNTKGYTRRTKSLLQFGSPLNNFTDENDREDEQEEMILDDYYSPLEDALFDKFGMENKFMNSAYRTTASVNGMKVRWWSDLLTWFEWQRLLYTDMLFAVLSILFVWIWMRVHTGSCFVSSMGMLQIVLSLPVAAFVYGTVIGLDYFQILHILVIFLVLGIGADDIFVFTDAWRQSQDEVEMGSGEDAEKQYRYERVRYSYSRTARAVFNTSFSTAAAFLSQTGSTLMPIATLGIYATLCILLNYIFAILFTPCVVLISEDYFGGCCSRKKKDSMAYQAKSANTVPEEPKSPGDEMGGSSKGETRLDRWLQKYYAEPFLYEVEVGSFTIKPISTAIFILLLGFAVQATYFAFQLTPPDEQEQWFPEDHMWTGFFDDLRDNYLSQTEEEYTEVDLVFGIKTIDRDSTFSFWNPGKSLGTPVFDENFDIYPVDVQQGLLDACQIVRDYPCSSSACDIDRAIWPNGIECFIEGFRDYMNNTHQIELPSNAISREDFFANLTAFRATDPGLEKQIGFIDGELKYVKFSLLSTTSLIVGYSGREESIDVANAMADEVREMTPSQLESVYITGGDVFVFYDTQTALITNLFQGLAICTPVVLILIALATKNAQISLMAVLSVMFVVASVLATCYYAGWSLGIAEAIAGVIVIGFAVDYSIHLGHMYTEGGHHGHESREDRFNFAVHTMGGTVLANTITTFGAGVFMFGVQLTFFRKMAVLICSTIGFSFVFSFGFFMSHCAVFGPRGDFANIDCKRCKGEK